jgi:hypothetical protein
MFPYFEVLMTCDENTICSGALDSTVITEWFERYALTPNAPLVYGKGIQYVSTPPVCENLGAMDLILLAEGIQAGFIEPTTPHDEASYTISSGAANINGWNYGSVGVLGNFRPTGNDNRLRGIFTATHNRDFNDDGSARADYSYQLKFTNPDKGSFFALFHDNASGQIAIEPIKKGFVPLDASTNVDRSNASFNLSGLASDNFELSAIAITKRNNLAQVLRAGVSKSKRLKVVDGMIKLGMPKQRAIAAANALAV